MINLSEENGKFVSKTLINLEKNKLYDDMQIIRLIYKHLNFEEKQDIYMAGGYNYICKGLSKNKRFEMFTSGEDTYFKYPKLSPSFDHEVTKFEGTDLLSHLPKAFVHFNNYIINNDSTPTKNR